MSKAESCMYHVETDGFYGSSSSRRRTNIREKRSSVSAAATEELSFPVCWPMSFGPTD